MPCVVESTEPFVASPEKGVAVHAASYYTTRDGVALVSTHGLESRSDICDIAFLRFSSDNGRTWGDAAEWPTRFDDPRGTGRRHPRGFWVDPATGRLLSVWTEGILPTDNASEGMTQYKVHYSVSEDGGKTDMVSEQIVHEGQEYDEVHHLPGVTAGRNCAMMGDVGQRPMLSLDGEIMLPVQISPTGPDGEYYSPGGGFTYTDCAVLFGRWRPDGGLAWTASERVQGDPNRTTRGLIEPTLARLSDGRILMVMRGSNHSRPELPGHKWRCLSSDEGHTWTQAEPWTYTDDFAFHSPSSCSQLVPYSDGRLFWIGNICEANPVSNAPRYPVVVGEVDLDSGRLIRDTVNVIDDLRPGDSPHLTLSNFYCREDRETGGLVLHMNRLFARDFREEGRADWTTDALLYRIRVV